MTEIKSYGRPPALVEKVMEAVMILRGNEPTWAEAKRQLGNNDGINTVKYRTIFIVLFLKRYIDNFFGIFLTKIIRWQGFL